MVRVASEILTHRGSKDQWHLISLWHMWGIAPCCEPLYSKYNRICFNKSKTMTLILEDTSMAAPFFYCQSTCMTQMTKDFTRCHDENYVNLNGVSIKSHQFVTNCPYQTIFPKHDICSSVFLLRFHESFAGRLRNQILTTCKVTWQTPSFCIRREFGHLVVENWHLIFWLIILT